MRECARTRRLGLPTMITSARPRVMATLYRPGFPMKPLLRLLSYLPLTLLLLLCVSTVDTTTTSASWPW